MSDNISHRIKQLRERLNYSQEEFAAPADLQFHQVSKYERGEAAPPADVLVRLNNAYNVNLHWLLMGEGEMFFIRSSEAGTFDLNISAITSADALHAVASKLESAYKLAQGKYSVTASWVLNQVQILNLLLELRKNIPRKRKLWRSSDVADTLAHDLKTNFPGERTLRLEERITKAINRLQAEERIDASYAWQIARCLRVVAHEFAFLEYAGKYPIPDVIFGKVSSLLVPWFAWIARTLSSTCLPLEVNPSLLEEVEKGEDENQEIEIRIDQKPVSMDAYTKDRRSVFLSTFKLLDGKLIIPCGASSLYSLVKALAKLAEDPKRGIVTVQPWELLKDHDVPVFSVQKDGSRVFLHREEFEQFISLAQMLWERPDVKKVVIRNVLAECGAL